MWKLFKWMVVVVLSLSVLLAGLLFGVHRWLGTDDFKARVQQEAGQAFGVALTLGNIEVSVWPVPAVALSGIRIHTQPPLTATRVEVRPRWRELLHGQVALATVLLRQAVLPQAGIDALLLTLQKKEQTNVKAQVPESDKPLIQGWMPRQTVLDGVTWISPKGIRYTLDGQVRLSGQGLPDDLRLSLREGPFQGATLRLLRDAMTWSVAAEVAGGTVKGKVTWEMPASTGQAFALDGQLETRGVDVALVATGGRPGGVGATLSGRLEASTHVSARTGHMAEVAQALQTQSSFTVRQAVVHGIDLARAVTTVGLSRGGETRLDTLAGQVTTQGTPKGMQVHLRNLVASSGVLSATGEVSLAPSHALSGRVSVNLAVGAVGSAMGVPLLVSGTLDAPSVTLTRSAMLGAAVGTLIMPGVGTGAGASLGDRVGDKFKKLFGK